MVSKSERRDVVELFRRSVEEVFGQSFGLPAKTAENLPDAEGYTARIPFSDGKNEYAATVWLERPVLETLAEILLCEERPDEATLEDLTAEVANFIVGHAKMDASDRGLPYRMETPRFDGRKPLQETGMTLVYNIGGRHVAVQLKETNG